MQLPGRPGTSAQPQYVKHQRGSKGKKMRHILTTAHMLSFSFNAGCCLQVGSGYQAPDFHTKALQHSRVQLTWDADEQTRTRGLARRLNAEQLREDDFKV